MTRIKIRLGAGRGAVGHFDVTLLFINHRIVNTSCGVDNGNPILKDSSTINDLYNNKHFSRAYAWYNTVEAHGKWQVACCHPGHPSLCRQSKFVTGVRHVSVGATRAMMMIGDGEMRKDSSSAAS